MAAVCGPDLYAADPADSGQEPWPDDYELTLRVAQQDPAADFSTINAAARAALTEAAAGTSVRVLIAPGLYREHVELVGEAGRTYAPMAIEAEEAGRAVISGSEIVNGWEVGDSDYFEKDFSPDERIVTVFVQSVRLARARPDRKLGGGQFRLVGDQVQLVPPGNATVADGLVEVATEAKGQLLSIQNLDTVFISGLYLRQSGGEGMRVQACRRVKLEHTTSEHHYISGYHFEDLERLALVNTDALRNGKEGIDAVNVGELTAVSGAASLNGYRVDEERMLAGDAFGLVVNTAKRLSLRNFQAADNRGAGLGIHYTEDVLIRRSKLLNNQVGMLAFRAGQVQLKEVVVAANQAAGVVLIETDCAAVWSVFSGNGETGGDGLSAQILAGDDVSVSLDHCIVSSTDAQVALVALEAPEQVDTFTGNLYWGSDQPFIIGSLMPHKDGTDPLDEALDFAAWQAVTGQDLDSAWGDPMFNDPKYFEFIPLNDSIWYQQKNWPVRTLTEAEQTAAREKYLAPASSGESAPEPVPDPFAPAP